MKKKNIRKYILEALAGLLVIGACLTVNDINRREAYADDPVTYTFREVVAPEPVGALSTETDAQIREKLPTRLSIKVRPSNSSEDETWEDAVDVSWGTVTAGGGSTKTCTGTVAMGDVTKNGQTTHIDSQQTVSAQVNITTVTYTFREVVAPEPVGALSTETDAQIREKLPTRLSIKVRPSNSSEDETWEDAVDVSWGTVTAGGGSTKTCTGTVATGDVTKNGKTTHIDSQQTVSAQVNITTVTTYRFDEVVAPAPSNAASSDSDTAIIGRLPSRLSIKVTPSNSSSQETWPDTVPVTWSTVTAVSSSVKNCSGTVAAGNYTYSGKTTNISTPQSVTAVINIVSDYDQLINNYSTSLLATDTNGDITIDVDISDSKKKDILKYVLNHTSNSSLKSAIQNALLSNNTKITMVFKADITSPDKTPKEEMKKEVEKKSGAAICTYFDLTLKIKIGDNSYEVNDIGSSNSVKFKIKVPEDERKSSRKYNAVRYHDNDADMLNDSYKDLDDKRFSFSTYLFSDYAISYTDSSSSSSSSSSSASTPKSNSAIVPGDDGTGAGAGGTDKSKTPKTGDDFNPRIWIYLLIVCATVASAAWILLQDTREDNEKKQK